MGTLFVVAFKVGCLCHMRIWHHILILYIVTLFEAKVFPIPGGFFLFVCLFVDIPSGDIFEPCIFTYLSLKLFQKTASEAITFLSQNSTLIPNTWLLCTHKPQVKLSKCGGTNTLFPSVVQEKSPLLAHECLKGKTD